MGNSKRYEVTGIIGIYYGGIKIGDCDSMIYTEGMSDDELIDFHETKRIFKLYETALPEE